MTEQELETFFTEENDIFNVILAKSRKISPENSAQENIFPHQHLNIPTNIPPQ